MKSLRKIVLGSNEAGRSCVVHEQALQLPPAQGAGFSVECLWSTDGMQGEIPVASLCDLTGAAEAMPEPGESRLHLIVIGPDGDANVDRAARMHITDTVDYLYVAEGELTILVDEGEVRVKQGDVIVDGGINHGWINSGDRPCVLLATMVGARRTA